MNRPTCSTCPLFVRQQLGGAGECHGEPPQLLAVGQQAQRLAGIGQQVQVQVQSIWRPVDPKAEACRHHPVMAAILAGEIALATDELRRARSDDHVGKPIVVGSMPEIPS